MGNYSTKSLRENESLVFMAKVHWAVFIRDIFLMIIVIGFITIIKTLINYFTTELTITNKRLIGKVGLINTKSLDSPLNKINNVSVSSGIMGKILGYGTLEITTSSAIYIFTSIRNPEGFRSTLMQEIEKFNDDKIKLQAQELANAMKSN